MSAADYDKSPRHSSPGRRDLDRNRSRSPGASRRSHGPARSPDRAPADRERSNSTNTGTNLFVSGLSMDVRNEDLEGIFSKYGKVLKCEVMFDPRTRESRGFGFVNFANVEDADDALTLNGADLLGRPLMVQKARRQRPRTPTPGEYRGPIKEILYGKSAVIDEF
ncbi:hypothetical protein QVD99_002601 [Batrachochytrium dendrobatidis]|nr:hypothetical protein QVD99_002601 [Batrachochytrium dendrobatidis]